MKASDGKRPCQEARVYYYDLLCADEAAVPLSVHQHVAACSFCRERMGRLREVLFESEREPNEGGVPDDETIEALTEQFRLLDERVTCSDARPCLPQLAMATPQIRIPTPVTVHADQCPQCAKDLTALRKLRLTTGQLRRLSHLFASQSGEGFLPWPACAGDMTPAESRPVEGIVMPCREVSAADIFDSVVPFGAPPGRRQQAIAAHIRACPVCLGRAQKLHRTIREIVERADSEIETVYHTAEDTPDVPTEVQDTYQYPVSVEVVHTGSGAASHPSSSRGISIARLRGLRHSAASAARVAAVGMVVVALAALVRTTVPTASGTNVGHVRKAIEKAPNVQIVVTDHQGEFVQELLVARRSARLVHRTTEKCSLYDRGHDRMQTIDPQARIGASARLSKEEREWAGQMMANCLLDVLKRISPDTRLHPPADNAGREAGTGLDVYELPPSRGADNSPVQDRRWAYIDPVTGLPQKMELYRRGPSEREWRPVTTTVYTYPTRQQMEDRIRALFPAP